MCWFYRKENKREKAMEILRSYVKQDSPIINMQLRNNKANSEEVELLDSLFFPNALPTYLYRWLPEQYVSCEGNVLMDKAYLSCSTKMDAYLSHMIDENLAFYIIETSDELKSIDIRNVLPEANDEQEFLLPREVKLTVIADKLYQQNDFGLFLKDIHCSDIRVNELMDHYQSIRLIKTTTH